MAFKTDPQEKKDLDDFLSKVDDLGMYILGYPLLV